LDKEGRYSESNLVFLTGEGAEGFFLVGNRFVGCDFLLSNPYLVGGMLSKRGRGVVSQGFSDDVATE
jgi:hypothetical protein